LKTKILISLLIVSSICNSQVEETFRLIRLGKVKMAYSSLDEFSLNNEDKTRIRTHLDYITAGYSQTAIYERNESNSLLSSYLEKITLADELYYVDGNPTMAIIQYEEAINIAKKLNNKVLTAEASLSTLIMFSYFYNQMGNETYMKFLKILDDNASLPVYTAYFNILKYRFGQRNSIVSRKSSPTEYLKLRSYFNSNGVTLLDGIRESFYAYHFIIDSSNIDSAKYFLNLSNKRMQELPKTLLSKERLVSNYLNLGALEMDFGNSEQSLKYIDSVDLSSFKGRLKKDLLAYYYFWKYEGSKKINSSDSLLYKSLYFELESSLSISQNNMTIANMNEIHKTDILKSEKQLILLIGIISLIVFAIIAFLVYRNTKRKQRIAEQEKELEIQKTTTLLKEQEITTINAMIEGQEKERLRLAGDLHDNLGGTLAAVKMHIGNLQANLNKSDNPQGLLDKANTLISEAYKDVRSIAHERNSGVMAKEGLLPAIEKLASKVSSSNGLSIEVQDFGLEDRLSNHIEITIFRIVQELITNIIKHAQATEATISLTQHDSELNIMVEDNGKGFKVGKLQDKDGMGLGSIERRVKHLEGTMEVDSSIGKGTNIIIDIPLIPA